MDGGVQVEEEGGSGGEGGGGGNAAGGGVTEGDRGGKTRVQMPCQSLPNQD
jgi:hypothetical protein